MVDVFKVTTVITTVSEFVVYVYAWMHYNNFEQEITYE